ncbi:FAD-dependent oxidoreductase [Ruminococcaceae bacterium OttesenSCG-928-D13]|nr:FAD-dependent oxidoreductase [Ruminococcaceae bacterium OttesenSCG-928-D13]
MADVIIIGGGPAGISAALYTVRAGLETLVIGRDGGALEKAEKIENYYGLAEPMNGRQLVEQGLRQAKGLGVQLVTDEVTGIGYDGARYRVKTKTGEHQAPIVVMATGSPRKKPTIKGLTDYEGRGVSYCATCDAFFYRGKDVAVLGCCDYALSEALELAPIAKSVTILTHGETPIQGIPGDIKVIRTKIAGLSGSDTLEGVLFEDGSRLDASGLFVAAGVAGSSDLAKKLGAQTEGTRIVTDASMATSIPGLFAAGDCTGGMLQIAKAVYEGAKAGTEAVKYHRSVIRSPN